MTVRYLTPQLVRWDGPGDGDDRRRVLQAVTAGVRRGIALAARDSRARNEPATGAPPAMAAYDEDAGLYTMPGYDSGGTPVAVPVQAAPGAYTAPHGDQIVPESFQVLPLIRISLDEYVRTGGSTHVQTPSLARAIGWGRLLFGALGYAILERRSRHPGARFVVVPLDKPLASARLGKGTAVTTEDLDAPADLRSTERGEFLPLADFWIVTAATVDGAFVYSTKWGTPWRPGAVWREYRRTPPAELIRPADIGRVAVALLGSRSGAVGDDALLGRIVNMDRTVFAFMPWEQRSSYLTTLARLLWPNERQKKAMVELVASARSRTELEAIFARLREHDVYERLFAKLDGTVADLLVLLGDWRPPGPMRPEYLISLFFQLNLVPAASLDPARAADPLRYLRSAADGLAFWVRSTVSGIADLFEHSTGELIEGVTHLIEFALVLQRATSIPPDPQALALVAQLAEQAGKTIRKAMAGLEYAEQLGSPYGQRATGTAITGDILTALKTALAVEVLSWFIGLGEIKEALAAVRLSERLAAIAKVLGALRGLGRAAHVVEEATKLERLLAVLARSARIMDDLAMARVLRLLPQEHLVELVRLADALDVPAATRMAGLRAAAKMTCMRDPLSSAHAWCVTTGQEPEEVS